MLIDRCKQDDRSAQYELYQLYAKAMFNVSYRIVNHEQEAEDVLQESFVKMFSQLGTYRNESSFGAWFKRIVVNQSINHLKKRNKELEKLENLSHEEFDEESVEESVPQATVSQIQSAMELLPEGYRIVFALYLFEDYSHQEIAKKLGISVSTSKSQLNRAKKKLKEIIKLSDGKP